MSRFCKQHFYGVEESVIHMKNRMRNIMEKIVSVDAMLMCVLTAVRAIISHENFAAVFTFMPLHDQKY